MIGFIKADRFAAIVSANEAEAASAGVKRLRDKISRAMLDGESMAFIQFDSLQVAILAMPFVEHLAEELQALGYWVRASRDHGLVFVQWKSYKPSLFQRMLEGWQSPKDE